MKKSLILIFLLVLTSISSANDNIVYLDIQLLLNNSEAGKNLNTDLQKINSKNINEFKKIEESIKKEDENLAKQKNILKEEDYNTKVIELRSKYKSYQDLMEKKNKALKSKRDKAVGEILKITNEILAEYSLKNSILIIIEKKNIVIGKTELDITNEILNLLNDKVKKIKLNE